MKRWLSWMDVTRGALWYASIVVVLPTTVLLVAGAIYLWQNDYLLIGMGAWMVITLLAYVLLVNWPRRTLAAKRRSAGSRTGGRNGGRDGEGDGQGDFDELPDQLSARADWSDRDREIWDASCEAVEEALRDEPSWNDLTGVAMQTLSTIASAYHGGKPDATYRFTLPEALLVVSIASARYRRLIQTNVPYADRVKIGTVVSLVQRKDTIKSSFTWYNRVRRTVRLINPVGAVIGEIRDHVTDRVLNRLGITVQTTLKRLLLQEISQVGIDLYSGRLRVSEDELRDYRSEAAQADEQRQCAKRLNHCEW